MNATWGDMNRILAAMDAILIAIEDDKKITKLMLQKLPPWRARLMAHVAEKCNVSMEVTHEEVRKEARRVGGEGRLWT